VKECYSFGTWQSYREIAPSVLGPFSKFRNAKNDACFTRIPCVPLWHFAHFFLGWHKFRTEVVEKSKHTFYVQEISCRKSFRLWDNVQNYCRTGKSTDDNIIRRMSSAWWISKATDICSEYVILFDFSKATMVRRSRLGVTLYVHCLCCFVKIRDFSWWLASRSLETLVLSYQSARRSRIQSSSYRSTQIAEKDIMFIPNWATIFDCTVANWPHNTSHVKWTRIITAYRTLTDGGGVRQVRWIAGKVQCKYRKRNGTPGWVLSNKEQFLGKTNFHVTKLSPGKQIWMFVVQLKQRKKNAIFGTCNGAVFVCHIHVDGL
jgi:hypothetical protein